MDKAIEGLLKEVKIPKLVKVRQVIKSEAIENIETVVNSELKKINFQKKICCGDSVAITVGSRGIPCLVQVLKPIINIVKELGGKPFIVSAMGSHGGGTVKGQKKILSKLGLNEKALKIDVIASIDVIEIGKTKNGVKVYFNRVAHEADKIIVINRVKPHNYFKNEVGSGLKKMIAIGLGNQKGCNYIHRLAETDTQFYKLIEEVAQTILKITPIAACIGIVENSFNAPVKIKAMNPTEVKVKELRLLKLARKFFLRLPFKDIDVLIVDEIGKEISGGGVDLIVIGNKNYRTDYKGIPRIKRLVILDLSSKSSGNANGIGLADVTTRKLLKKLNYEETYMNLLSSGDLAPAKIPLIMKNDELAIKAAIFTLQSKNMRMLKMVRIKNTTKLDKIQVSRALGKEVRKNSFLKICGKLEEVKFKENGVIC
jgi:hypothetical protein